MMGKNQRTLSIPKELWLTLEKDLEDNRDVLELLNINTVPDIFKVCTHLGMKNLQQTIAEFRITHKMTKENPQKPAP